MMSYSIAIPSRGVNSSLIRVLVDALQVKEIDEILVGINPDNSCLNKLLEPHLNDPRVKIFHHKSDIGLYGNFRFLLNQATGEYFSWLCTDDKLSESVPALLQGAKDGFSNLAIPTWFWAEYYPDTVSFSLDNAKEGNYPNLSDADATLKSIIYCEPSWIFGIWRTKYLQSIFPASSFDWLDTYLLQKVLLTKKVISFDLPKPMIIGTWHWKNKIPSCVNGRFHNPYPAILRQFLILYKMSKISPKAFKLVYQRCQSLVKQSKSMNKQLRMVNSK